MSIWSTIGRAVVDWQAGKQAGKPKEQTKSAPSQGLWGSFKSGLAGIYRARAASYQKKAQKDINFANELEGKTAGKPVRKDIAAKDIKSAQNNACRY